MPIESRRVTAFICLLACAGASIAHAPYLLPNDFELDQRDHVSVQASFTEAFFIPDVAMKSDDYHVVMPDGAKLPVAPAYTRDLAVLDVATPTAGTYRISTGNRPGRIGKAELLPDGTWKFFGEREKPLAGAQLHDMHSITRADVYVSVGTPTDTALALTGQGLEFQLLTHPGRLLAGTPLKLRAVYDGKPVPGLLIEVRRGALEEGASAPVEVRTAADGGATVPLARPGIYHIMARHRFGIPGAAPKAESHTYALTVEVAE
jgi:uncharacterized GH25 family protein